VCDVPDAPVVERARAAGAIIVVVDRDAYPDRDTYERALVVELLERRVELVVLAGYMRICGQTFLDAYEGRTINLHPSLLPDFPGRDAIGDALAAGATRTGVTVHFIDAGIDTGPVIRQEVVEIRPDDTRESLATRNHELEHQVLPQVVAAIARGDVRTPLAHHHPAMEVPVQ
jgi:phosphoribosylglycinamide formyltransferase-1